MNFFDEVLFHSKQTLTKKLIFDPLFISHTVNFFKLIWWDTIRLLFNVTYSRMFINLFIYVLTQYLKWEVQILRYCRFLANRYKLRKVALKVPFFWRWLKRIQQKGQWAEKSVRLLTNEIATGWLHAVACWPAR